MSEPIDGLFTQFETQEPRINQRQMLPGSIRSSALSQTTLANTNTDTLGPFTVANNASLSIQSVVVNDNNPLFRLGGVPYCIAFFQTSLTIANIIGSGITGTYTINGPMPMPQFTPVATNTTAGGNDGNNLVFLTELINKSGSSQTIYCLTNTRVYTPVGGSAV